MLIPQESGEALELLAQDVGGVLPVALPLDVFVGSLGDLVVPGAHVLEAGAAGGREVNEDVRERTYPRVPAAVGAFLLCYVRDSELVMVAPADLAFQVEEGDEVENPALLQSLDGVLDAAHPILARLFEKAVYVRLLRAAGRVHVRRTATHGIKTFGLEVHLPEVAAARALAALVGVSH